MIPEKMLNYARRYAKNAGLRGPDFEEAVQESVIWFWTTKQTNYLFLRNAILNYQRRLLYAKANPEFTFFSELENPDEVLVVDEPGYEEVEAEDFRGRVAFLVEAKLAVLPDRLSQEALVYLKKGRDGLRRYLRGRRRDGRFCGQPNDYRNEQVLSNKIVRIRALLSRVAAEEETKIA